MSSKSENEHKLAQLKSDLGEIEKNIYALEQDYIEDTDYGNIVRGWDDRLLSLKPYSRKYAKPTPKDRIFSQSSATAAPSTGNLPRSEDSSDLSDSSEGHK
jgi:hypothetical protein